MKGLTDVGEKGTTGFKSFDELFGSAFSLAQFGFQSGLMIGGGGKAVATGLEALVDRERGRVL